MGCITKIAAVENATAIWEYDPSLPDNRVLGGSLDMITAVRTIAIKIQASGQCIEYFEQLQSNCQINNPLRIPLHSNVRWGLAYHMLDRSYSLCQPINLFLKSADALYGPITTVRRNGQIVKRIPWSAFQLTDADWGRVKDTRDILKDSCALQHCFSSEQLPTLWRALPAIEELQTAWEAKRDDPHFAIYFDAISDGLVKLQKYYSRFNEKPAYVLALALHPYYKLEYIKIQDGMGWC
ncbi:hypothetical protein EDB83DRAFT_2526308 [Lactarius deliciosus]|nr:hypothetical protein EDB83DRAFT_2526308 [Lactarius deliciosus]